YWSRQLNRPELDRAVPDIASAIYDAKWKGTGNWPFNTAYAGSIRGIRAYVARLSDLAEVEDWITAGIPVGLSVCYDRLHHRGPGPNGHLVVCVGFTGSGDPVVNDPGTSKDVRRVYPRKDLIYAWSSSRNTVYLIYPEDHDLPTDRFGHWDSATSRQRFSLVH
ncbi:MAG: C39 family peptidase, partial [Verrucomicrobia bacterium]|nr:C39 family peptidase [Verrucomicrobiota bacterium]